MFQRGVFQRGVFQRGVFQCHGRLPFKAGTLMQVTQRGYRIKQPPHAGGYRAVEPLVERGDQQAQFSVAEVQPVPWKIRTIHGIEQAEQTAPWLARGGVSTWQRKGAQMGDALESVGIDAQEFPAPDGVIDPVAGAVP